MDFTSNLKQLQQELNDAAGITDVSMGSLSAQVIYAPDGTPRNQMSHGVNIVRRGDKAIKIFQK